MESSPHTFLSFNEQMTQESIFERLSPELSREWFRYRREKSIPKGAVNFEIFADWINAQASIELERIGSDRKESLSSSSPTAQNEKTGSALSQPASQPSLSRTTSPVGSSPGQNRAIRTSCKVCGKKDHESALECKEFRKLADDEKHRTCSSFGLLAKRLCINCLNSSCNRFRDCPKKERCRTCRYDHHATIACRSDSMRNSPGINNRQQ